MIIYDEDKTILLTTTNADQFLLIAFTYLLHPDEKSQTLILVIQIIIIQFGR